MITNAQLAEWNTSRYRYKMIASAIALWARNQQPGTLVPDNQHFAGDLTFTATRDTWQRAKKLLTEAGVIHTVNGPYQVT